MESRARKRICRSFRVARDRQFYDIVSYRIVQTTKVAGTTSYLPRDSVFGRLLPHAERNAVVFIFARRPLSQSLCWPDYSRASPLVYVRVRDLPLLYQSLVPARVLFRARTDVKGRSRVYTVKLKRSNTCDTVYIRVLFLEVYCTPVFLGRYCTRSLCNLLG